MNRDSLRRCQGQDCEREAKCYYAKRWLCEVCANRKMRDEANANGRHDNKIRDEDG